MMDGLKERGRAIGEAAAARVRGRVAAALRETLPEAAVEVVGEDVVLEDSEEGPDALRVFLTLAEARSFADHAGVLVAAGRPPCPLCANPLDPEGHICPRLNGYHRGSLGS